MSQDDEVTVYDELVRKAMRDGLKPDEARRRANQLLDVMSTDSDVFGVVKANGEVQPA